MHNQSYKLRSGLAGFMLLPQEILEVTIPTGSVLVVLQSPSDGTGFTRVQYENRTFTVPLRELRKCGVLLYHARGAGKDNNRVKDIN